MNITPPVPLELNTKDPGCYVKYTFPIELSLPNSSSLNIFGSNILATQTKSD